MKHYKRLSLMALSVAVLLTFVSALSLTAFAEDGSSEKGDYSVASLLQDGSTTYYDSLKAAVDASSDGDTIKLLANVDLTDESFADEDGFAVIEKTITLNLDQYEITGGALDVYGTLTISGSGSVTGADKYGIWINSGGELNLEGGTISAAGEGGYPIVVSSGTLNISGGTVSNTAGKGAVCALHASTLEVSGGEIVSSVDSAVSINGSTAATISDGTITGYDWGIAAFDTSELTISGGSIAASDTDGAAVYSDAAISITGGKYSSEPDSSYLADGYKAAAISEETYQVGAVTTSLSLTSGSLTDDTVTYTVSTVIKDEDGTELYKNEELTVTVVGTDEDDETVSPDGESIAAIPLTNIKDLNTLGDIVESALDAAGTKIHNLNAVTIQIRSKKSAPVTNSGSVTYDVYPEATVVSNSEEIASVVLDNDQLIGSFSFKLYAKNIGVIKAGAKIKVTDDATEEEVFTFKVDSDGYINVTGVTEFSTFTLTEVTDQSTTAPATFGYAISLEESINIVFNVKNLTDDPENYTITVIEPDGDTSVKTLEDETLNSYTIAECSAKEMGDVYTVYVKHNGTRLNSTTKFSVKGYCDTIIEGNYGKKLVNLCKATLDYGRYAQEVFSYKTHKLVNDGEDNFDIDSIEVPSYGGVTEGSCDDLKSMTFSLITTSEAQFKVFFKFKDDAVVDNYTVRDDNNKKYSVNNNQIKVVVGVAAKDLGTKKNFYLKSGSDTVVTFTASPVDYMGLAIANGDGSQDKINKALYNYYCMAQKYFA